MKRIVSTRRLYEPRCWHYYTGMSQMTVKQLRRHKRRVENDAFASGARFWSNQKTVWANDATIRRPANKNALDLVGPEPRRQGDKKGKRSVSVYLFRIKTKGHDEVFLKIGISNSVSERFEQDTVKYKFSLLCCVDGLTRREALAVEGRLHEMFSSMSYRPRFGFVSGGYTECFVDEEVIFETTRKVFDLVDDEKRAVLAQQVEQSSRKGKVVSSTLTDGTIQMFQWFSWIGFFDCAPLAQR